MILVAKVWKFIHPQLCYCVCILKNWTIIVNTDFIGKRIPRLRSQRQKWTLPSGSCCLLWGLRSKWRAPTYTSKWKAIPSGTAIWNSQSTVPRSLSHWANPYLRHIHSFLNTIHPFPYYVLYTCGKLPIHRIWYSG